MKRKFSYNHNETILYLVATPIGNLSDMTYRAVDVLKRVDIIYAEDTRNSKVLLNHYNIKTPLYSYHEYNKELKENEIIDFLKSGKNIAVISDAGLPVISDPGYDIALSAIKNDIAVTTIPGACAFVSALVSSGLPPMPHTFYGFLDSKKTKRCEELKRIKMVKHTMIFYEAPHRILDTLKDILEVLGDRDIVIGREITKKFEEFIRGKASQLVDQVESLKGEIVLLVSGFTEELEDLDVNHIEKVNEYIKLGMKSKEAIKEVSTLYSIDRRQLYNEYIKSKDDINK